jgi:DNA primase large subunit
MQLETAKFTSADLAKYPFLKQTSAYMKRLSLDIDELASPEFARILQRAQSRLENSISFVLVGKKSVSEYDIEIPSFPIAIMLAIATKNSFIKKRYALAEAKQAYNGLDDPDQEPGFQGEPNEKLVAIAHDFGWDININSNTNIPLEFSIAMPDYLRNITHLRDEKWKLINRILVTGRVYLNKHDTARLLQEEVQRRIENRLETKEQPNFPQPIMDIADSLNVLAKEKIGESEMEGFPKEVSQSAFPPCIQVLYDAAQNGRHIGHVGRFTLTSFLITIGMPTENVAEVFKASSDYNARLTRYQVEHIAGSHGSGTKYTPPACSTLQTHGVCVNSDQLCRRVRHPLNYYLRKQRMQPEKTNV